MRNLKELNMNESDGPVTRKPPTESDIAIFQSLFRVVLPNEYLAFLRHSNGGHPEIDMIELKGQDDHSLYGVNRFYFLNDDKDDLEGITAATRTWREALSANIVAIGDDGGGNQYLLSFDDASPSVKICIHDEAMRIVHLADSFGEFIDMLSEDPDMI